ncbi:GntR family transcriptional regulator [Paracandidimonas soli]|uniref:GntR family transcriptional regulator n=1 Tax=Paracandidimonas soli TaxID=1917182 RepID=UPI003341DDFF
MVSGTKQAAAGTQDKPKRLSLADKTYAVLKEQILDQRLAPGARLNIDALARELNVSSSPLREALSHLEAERLVNYATNTGYSVASSPTPQFLRDLMEYRAVTEGYCARIGAATATEETIRAMKETEQDMRAMRELGSRFRDYKEYTELDSLFHGLIVDSARNEVLSMTYRSMHAVLTQARMSLFRDAGSIGSDAAIEEHAEIVRAYESRDGALAEAAVRKHLKGSQERMFDALQRRQGLDNPPLPRWALDQDAGSR